MGLLCFGVGSAPCTLGGAFPVTSDWAVTGTAESQSIQNKFKYSLQSNHFLATWRARMEKSCPGAKRTAIQAFGPEATAEERRSDERARQMRKECDLSNRDAMNELLGGGAWVSPTAIAVSDAEWAEMLRGAGATAPEPGPFGAFRSVSHMYDATVHGVVAAVLALVQAQVGVDVWWVPDAFCYRDRPLGGEKPHRDRAPFGIYAAWIADTESTFTLVRGSAVERRPGQGGAGFVAEASATLNHGEFETVTVPAGHVLVFDPTVVHQVARVDYSAKPQRRLFVGISVCDPSAELVECVRWGRYAGAPSGEQQTTVPRMYVIRPDVLAEKAKGLAPYMTEERTAKKEMAASNVERLGRVLGERVVPGVTKYMVPKFEVQPVPRDVLARMEEQVRRALQLIGAISNDPEEPLMLPIGWPYSE